MFQVPRLPLHIVDQDFHWLLNKRFNRYSQFGEDGIIRAIFAAVPPRNRWAFECGAGDGVRLSNTLWLVESDNWRAIHVERNDRAYESMTKRHHSRGGLRMGLDRKIIRINAELAPLGENSVSSILARNGVPIDLDFLSLDIDGGEEDILYGLGNVRPRVMCVEHYGPAGPHLASLLRAIGELCYVPIAATACNVFCTLPGIANRLRRMEQ